MNGIISFSKLDPNAVRGYKLAQGPTVRIWTQVCLLQNDMLHYPQRIIRKK